MKRSRSPGLFSFRRRYAMLCGLLGASKAGLTDQPHVTQSITDRVSSLLGAKTDSPWDDIVKSQDYKLGFKLGEDLGSVFAGVRSGHASIDESFVEFYGSALEVDEFAVGLLQLAGGEVGAVEKGLDAIGEVIDIGTGGAIDLGDEGGYDDALWNALPF